MSNIKEIFYSVILEIKILFISIIIIILIFLIYIILGNQVFLNLYKGTSFECGFNTFKSARVPISIQFFLLILIFLIFDVEIALLFPLLANVLNLFKILNLFSISIFLLILISGVYFEWFNNKLNWYAMIIFD